MLQKAGNPDRSQRAVQPGGHERDGQVLRMKSAAPRRGAGGRAWPPARRCRMCNSSTPDIRERFYQTHGAAKDGFHPHRRQEGRGRDHGGRAHARAGSNRRWSALEARGRRICVGLRETVRLETGDVRRQCLRCVAAAPTGRFPWRSRRVPCRVTPEFRTALRDAASRLRQISVATQGVYNMTPADHSGFDRRGRVLLTVKGGKWGAFGELTARRGQAAGAPAGSAVFTHLPGSAPAREPALRGWVWNPSQSAPIFW